MELPRDTPQLFGDYKVEEYVKAGAFGHVFRVSKEGIDYGLKWLKEDPPSHGLDRIKNEIWALKQLDHPSIPKVFAEGLERDRPWFVMSYVRGIDLARQIEQKRKDRAMFSEMEVLRVLVDVLSALAHMHDRGITHRDVKHDNIVTDAATTRCWLLDVGCCAAADRPYTADTFWNVGASRFSPPSKLNYPKVVVPNHDVFAVGVVGYLLLTRQYLGR